MPTHVWRDQARVAPRVAHTNIYWRAPVTGRKISMHRPRAGYNLACMGEYRLAKKKERKKRAKKARPRASKTRVPSVTPVPVLLTSTE